LTISFEDSAVNYPFDSTGQSSKNTVIGDEQSITVVFNATSLTAFPSYTPFYFHSVAVKHTGPDGVVSILQAGVDFLPGFQYLDATAKTNKLICGAISFVNPSLQGTFVFNYQCVGGSYNLTPSTLVVIRATEKRDPIFTTWESLCDTNGIALSEFPVVAYPWTGDDTGLMGTIKFLEKSGLVVHLRPEFLSTPSDTVFIPTKAEVGLGLVENYPMATVAQAKEGVLNEAYMSPKLVKEAISAQVTKEINTNGYKLPVPYTPGLRVDDKQTTIRHDTSVYAPRPEALPLTLIGNFNVDKEKLILVSSTDRDHWNAFSYTVTGNEQFDTNDDSIIIETGISFTSDVKSIIILNYIGELIRTVDYNLDNGRIKLLHPVGSGDSVVFLYKRKSSILSDDRPFHRMFKIVDGTRSFPLPGFDFMKPDDVRVTLNNFSILTRVTDYDIVNNILNFNFPLKLDDTLEVLANDAVPPLGVLQSRLLLYSDR
jgi:hypothetical protein